jgi:small ligand-binding sensory domain FIST
MSVFAFAHAASEDWQVAVDSCLTRLGSVPKGANLGFLYVTDDLADHMAEVLSLFRQATGVEHWVGTVGIGICASGVEYYEQPAVVVMVADLPEDSFRVFPAMIKDLDEFSRRNGAWIAEHRPYIGLVHGDPSNPLTEALVKQLATKITSGFLVGGLASSRGPVYLFADGITQGGIAGVLFSDRVAAVTRLSQGCSPIGPQHGITESQRNIMIELDGRPALDVFKEDVGEILARDLTRAGGYIFAGLPIAASDTGDYLVRNLLGVDPKNKLLAIGGMVEPGGRVMFCRRDAVTAREDLLRMLRAITKDLKRPPRGGIYVSCLGRGVNLFGPDSEELKLIQAELGEVPLVGFYANGEISQDRLYGYTGVLTLFL